MNRRQTTFWTAMMMVGLLAASAGQMLGQAAGGMSTAWTQRGESDDVYGIYGKGEAR